MKAASQFYYFIFFLTFFACKNSGSNSVDTNLNDTTNLFKKELSFIESIIKDDESSRIVDSIGDYKIIGPDGYMIVDTRQEKIMCKFSEDYKIENGRIIYKDYIGRSNNIDTLQKIDFKNYGGDQNSYCIYQNYEFVLEDKKIIKLDLSAEPCTEH